MSIFRLITSAFNSRSAKTSYDGGYYGWRDRYGIWEAPQKSASNAHRRPKRPFFISNF